MTSTPDTAELLRRYFIQQRSVNLPGIGSFVLNRIPAQINHASGNIEAPSFTIQYDSLNDIPTKEVFAYISRKRNISEWEAIGVVNNFALALNDQLKKGKKVEWEGMGSLENSSYGQLIFEPVTTRDDFQPHLISLPQTGLVHDRHDTGGYNEIPYENEEQGMVEAEASWWVSAAVIGAAALVMIFFSLVRNEYNLSGARQTKLLPSSTPSQYESKAAE
jgi:nucleoid DNA-binding protein